MSSPHRPPSAGREVAKMWESSPVFIWKQGQGFKKYCPIRGLETQATSILQLAFDHYFSLQLPELSSLPVPQ
jgi:hypothetical protein